MSTAASGAPGSAPPSSGTAVAPDAMSPHHARRWLVLAVIGIAQLMVILDATIVNIALPSAQQDLGFSDANRQWIITSYALPFGSLLLLGGRLSDLFGRRVAFMSGLVGFAVASAVGGAATSFGLLVTARAAQGVFGALLAPAALALLTTTFTDIKERGKAFGIFGAIAGSGGAVGLLLGGVLTEHLSWRWCMYVNLFFAGAALVGAALLLHRMPRGAHRPPLDIPGTLTGSAGLFGIVYGFANAERYDWGDPMVWGFLVGGVAMLVVFVLLQNWVAHPLLPMRVILDRDRGGAYLSVLVIGVGMFGIFLFLTYYMQQTLGFSPIGTGVAFLPMVAAIMVSATSSTALLLPRFGSRPLVAIGMAVAAGGLFWLSTLDINSTFAANVLPPLLVSGLGLGLAMAPAIQSATLGVQPSDAGVASATVNTMQQVGGSIGTALLATIAGNAATDYLQTRVPNPQVFAEAAVHSYTVAFLWAGGIFLAGAVLCGLILRSGVPQGVTAGPGGFEMAIPVAEEAPAAVPAPAARPSAPPARPSVAHTVLPPAAPAGAVAVQGLVRTAAGRPFSGATLTLIDVNGAQVNRGQSGPDGRYHLGVPGSGSYVLICSAPPNQPAALRIDVGSHGSSHDVVVASHPDDLIEPTADPATIG